MKLSVQRLLADTLTLELPSKQGGEPNMVLLEHGVNVRGTMETGDGTNLEHITGDNLDIGRGRWRFGKGILDLSATMLEAIELNLRIPREGPTVGHIQIGSLHGLGSDFLIDENGRRIHCDRLSAKDVIVRLTPEATRIEVGALELGMGTAKLGEQDIAWRDVRVTRLVITLPKAGDTLIEVGALVIDGVEAVLERIMPKARERTHDDRIADADDDLRQAQDPRELGDKALAPDLDWSFLDAINGKIDLDLALDVSVPLIKHFKGKNEFRIPIDAGVIDYKKTEHQLATVIDTFLDLELEEDRLVLEKDIPMVPSDEKVLFYWPLDAAARALAAADKIRLCTLMRAMKPGRTHEELEDQAEDAAEEKADAISDKAEGEAVDKATIRLLGLDLDNVDVSLTLGRSEASIGGGTISIGGAGGGLETGGTLTVKGDFHYRAEGDVPADVGELHVALEDLKLGARDVKVGTITLNGSLRGNIDDVIVRVGGPAPRSLALKTEQITLSDASIALRSKAAA